MNEKDRPRTEECWGIPYSDSVLFLPKASFVDSSHLNEVGLEHGSKRDTTNLLHHEQKGSKRAAEGMNHG